MNKFLNDIQKLRKDLDKITQQLVTLIARRKKLILKLAKIKKEIKMPIKDKKREEEIFKKLKVMAEKKGLDYFLVEKIMKLLINNARKLQK